MFKHGAKNATEDKKKEKERKKTEKKEQQEDRKRAVTTATGTNKATKEPSERSLSSPTLNDAVSPRPSSPVSSTVISPRNVSTSPAVTSHIEPISLDREDSEEGHSDLPRDRATPPAPAPISAAPHVVHPSPHHVAPTPSPLSSSLSSLTNSDDFTKRVSAGKSTVPLDPVALLKSKISSLPPDTKQLVEYLLNIFGRALPQQWSAPPNLEAPALDDQVDVTLDKLVEASEILFNKDAHSMLKRYGKELRESPSRRTDKWKIITNLIEDEASNFLNVYLTSNALEAVVTSALAKPLEGDESEILADLLKLSIIRDVAHKELLSVVQTASLSNAHVKNALLDDNKSLVDSIIDLVCSFRKLSRNPEDEIQVQDLSGKKDADVSDSFNQSVALLEHANTIKHAKGGSDIIHPLEHFFKAQILAEVREGEKWQAASEEAKGEKAAKLRDIDDFVKEEEGKLQSVQANITDLETKLEQKRAEEKSLQESLEQKLAEREQYQKQREQTEAEIKAHIDETAQHLEHHKKAEESVVKFSQDITVILDREVNETLKKTKEVLQELDKEVTFLEEKMITYERSISLFNAADEPEVLDGLRKLFARSTAIYAESRQSVSRVSGVVELLHTVLGKESSQVEELGRSLEKIAGRQSTLNTKYKLQKE